MWSHLGQTLGVCLMKSQASQVRQGGLIQPLRPPLLSVILLQPPDDALQCQLPHLILFALQDILQKLACELNPPPKFGDLYTGTEGHLGQTEQVLAAARPLDGGGCVRGDKFRGHQDGQSFLTETADIRI